MEAKNKAKQCKKELADSKARPKTLGDIWGLYYTHKLQHLAEPTIKRKKAEYKHLEPLKNKQITRITASDILKITDELHTANKHNMLGGVFNLANILLDFAVSRGFISKNPMQGIQKYNLYHLEKGHYGYLDINDPNCVNSLKLLINFIAGYNGNIATKNALIVGLLTGLRAKNVRFLSPKHIIKKDNNYLLDISNGEVKNRRRLTFVIPQELGEWLNNLQVKNGNDKHYFQGRFGGVLSDGTLSKALKPYDSLGLHIDGDFVFHSLRKVLSSFCHLNLGSRYYIAIETLLDHSVKTNVSRLYDHSNLATEIGEVLDWWLNYINGLLGKNILGDKK